MIRTLREYLVPTEHRRVNEFIGLLLAAVALLVVLSLISFNPDDPSFSISRNPSITAKPANFIGTLGAYIADVFLQLLGFSSFLLPTFLGFYAFHWLTSRKVEAFGSRASGMVLMTLTVAASFSALPWMPMFRSHIPAGGFLGRILADKLDELLNPAGTAVVLLTSFFVSLFLSTTFSFTWALEKLRPRFAFVGRLSDRYTAWQQQRRMEEEQRRAEERKAPKKQVIVTPKDPPRPLLRRVGVAEEEEAPAGSDAQESDTAPADSPAPYAMKAAAAAAAAASSAPIEPLEFESEARSAPLRRGRSKALPSPRSASSASFPPATLLHAAVEVGEVNEEEVRARATLLEQKAAEFEVVGSVRKIHPGPVVTTFEFKPEPGVKYSKITGLGDDLCLALEAESVRIDRIPGKSTVGIEVPNDKRATIMLRQLIESSEYNQSNMRLPLALGQDIRGKNVISDLQKMPHLLLAGSTGTGKSVSINTMILSLVYRARPDQVKLIMIDPKRLELGLYQDIPHLLVPVVTEPKVANNALRWAVMEMETRYKKLATRGVRTLEAYNEQVMQLDIPGLGAESADGEDAPGPLPYIVIIIDELADLMMTAAREVEESITRLAQMARAVGIHLILATQRPSVDVITGLIKANFPARISFRTTSKVDSRTILDTNGAEQLLGRGDMLFLPPGSSRLMRVHGSLVSESEVTKVVEFLKTQGKPVYNERILEAPSDEHNPEDGGGDGELDELYDDAVRIVLEMGKASTSALQRRLRVGYGRAASMLDGMERAGIIGPPDGTKPRAVLIKREDYFSE
jgi:S-DNA-T family DNA segregation ATPase FtsK/SpoIIIE